jgi:hypothetical protein
MHTKNNVFIRNSDILTTNMDGEVVMMDVDQGSYFSLSSGVGATIWSVVETPASLDDIISAVCAQYETTPDECRADIEGFVQQLHDQKLVKLATAA